MVFPFKTPKIFHYLFPSMVWKKQSEKLYLTFDDGPHPTITPWVIDLLRKYNIKATFFCVGENVQKHPETVKILLSEGHVLGNHTHHHLNGWKTSVETYIKDVDECAQWVDSNLFRPPYGRLRKKQRFEILKNFKIIQWSLLSGDFDPNLDQQKALKALCSKTTEGSIIVFHDSVKAENNLKNLLPKYLEYCIKKGYKFAPL